MAHRHSCLSCHVSLPLVSWFTDSHNLSLFSVCFGNCSFHPSLEVFVYPLLTSQWSPGHHILFPPWMLEAVFILYSSCYAYISKWARLASGLFPLELQLCVFDCFLTSISSRDLQMHCVHSWVSQPVLSPLPSLCHQSPSAALFLPKWFSYLFYRCFIVLVSCLDYWSRGLRSLLTPGQSLWIYCLFNLQCELFNSNLQYDRPYFFSFLVLLIPAPLYVLIKLTKTFDEMKEVHIRPSVCPAFKRFFKSFSSSITCCCHLAISCTVLLTVNAQTMLDCFQMWNPAPCVRSTLLKTLLSAKLFLPQPADWFYLGIQPSLIPSQPIPVWSVLDAPVITQTFPFHHSGVPVPTQSVSDFMQVFLCVLGPHAMARNVGKGTFWKEWKIP